VRDLEICSNSLNIQHGRVVKVFGLYDTPISVYDIETIRKELVDEDKVASIKAKYSSLHNNRMNNICSLYTAN
jgi:hypothetical protein